MLSNMSNNRAHRTAVSGYCIIVAGLSFVFGMLVYALVFMELGYGDLSAPFEDTLNVLTQHSLLLHGWYFIIYIVFGLALIGFQVGIQSWLRAGSVRQACAVLGYLWAGLTIATGMLANVGNAMVLQLAEFNPQSSRDLWYVLQMLIDGLGGGNELVGGCWLITLAVSIRSFGAVGQYLKIFAFGVGLVGVLSSAPGLDTLGGIFGVGCIVWFLWIGSAMIQYKDKQNA